MKVGDVIADNDPRMRGRMLTVREICTDGRYVYADDGHRKALFRISAKRIHADGKPRRTGFRLINGEAA